MKRKEVTTTFHKTVQIEEYCPEKIGVSQTIELEEGDDPDEVLDELHEENVAFVAREITSRMAAKRMSDSKADE